MFKLFIIASALNVSASAQDMYVMIDTTFPANTTYLSVPADTPVKKIAAMEEYVAKNSKTTQLIKMSALKKDKNKYLTSKIKKNYYPKANVVDRFILLLEKNPGSMFSLVFNGGIAITKNDHTHAGKIYAIYLADPKKYDQMHKSNEKSWDPIHPENHFGPLGIK